MDSRRILYSLARKWWLIVLLALLGGGIGFVNVYYSNPLYQASTKLYIMNLESQQLVRQYFDIIYSRALTSEVSQELKEYNLSGNAILSMVSITSKVDSNIFIINARGSDPTIAAAVANATGRVFSTKIRQLSNSDNVGILDEALVPIYPISNNGLNIILLGLLTGLMVAFGIIYIIEYFDTTVRSVEDIEKGLNLSVIGIIPELNIR